MTDTWNIILWIIAGCSLVSFTIFIERLLHLKKASLDTNQFLLSIRDCVKEGHLVEAIVLCEKKKASVSNIIKAGLLKHNREREVIERAMETAGLIEINDLEKNGKILSMIATICPLIGLLGTVLGFIQAFSEMRASGLVDISAARLGGAMEYALVTTAAGLAVAIPTVLAYNYIVSRIETFVLEMQTTSFEVLDLLIDREV